MIDFFTVLKGQQTKSTPLEVIKDLWQEEVEKRPQLCQVVLQWRACQQQLVVSGQQLQLLHQPTVEVFDPVAFVHDKVLPLEALEQKADIVNS